MLKTTDELKEFILWAKEQGLKEAKIGEHTFSFSEYELAKKLMQEQTGTTYEPESSESTNVRAQNLREDLDNFSEDDEIRYWSSKP